MSFTFDMVCVAKSMFRLNSSKKDPMKFLTSLFTVVLLCTPLVAESIPTAVDLAHLDKWQIVVAADAIASERYAAEELQRYYKQASGIELPLVDHAGHTQGNLFVGASSAMRSSAVGFDVDLFGQEDLRIIVRDGNIAIAGGRPRGTLYGVYTFLEDYLGVRFLTPDHTHVPRVGMWRKIGPVDRFYHPPLDFRWICYEANYQLPEYATKLRLNAARLPYCPVEGNDWSNAGKLGGRTSMQEINHSFHRQLPPSVYAKEHPEYYCLFRGHRLASVKPGEGGYDFKRGSFPYGMQPCLSHPDVSRIITDRVLSEFATRPDLLNISVAQNDGGAHCQCPDCAAVDKREGGPQGSLLQLVNTVADKVAQDFPDRFVATLAYSDTAGPPATLRPRENVQIMWCSISTCFLHGFADRTCPTNEWHIGQLRRWAKLTDHLYVWNYYMNDENQTYQLPLPNLRLAEPNIRFQVALGVKGMFLQSTSSCHSNEFDELRNYLLSSLLWDPSRDGDKLMQEWLDLHYGPASPPITRWIHRLHDRSVASGKHCRCLGGRYEDYGLDQTDIDAGLEAIEQALELAQNDETIRRRVEKASIWAYRAAIEPAWNVKDGESLDADVADQMRPLVQKFFELCDTYGVTRTAEGEWNRLENQKQRLSDLVGRE